MRPVDGEDQVALLRRIAAQAGGFDPLAVQLSPEQDRPPFDAPRRIAVRPSNEISWPSRARSASPCSGGKSKSPQRRFESRSCATRSSRVPGGKTARQPAAIDGARGLRLRQRRVRLGEDVDIRHPPADRAMTRPRAHTQRSADRAHASSQRRPSSRADTEERGAERARAPAPAARAPRRRRCARTP